MDDETNQDLPAIKARLLVLSNASIIDSTAEELAEIAASRDSEEVGDPR